VLIVDRSDENREVLQTVLERHGVRTLAAREPEKAAELARQNQVDLVVLDVESCRPEEVWATAAGEIDCSSSLTSIRLSVPGREHRPPPNLSPCQAAAPPPHVILLGRVRDRRSDAPEGEFIAKPYHYGPLIRRIEELLGLSMPPTGSWMRGDAVCHPRSRSGQPL
jgi:CheY-like chemotaxis protein